MSRNIDVFKPVRTKGGHKVKITAVDFRVGEETWPIRADVVVRYGETEELSFTAEGLYRSLKRPSRYDLENVPETKTFWINVYDEKEHRIHESEEDAVAGSFRGGSINKQDTTLFARVKVTVEEGEGLG